MRACRDLNNISCDRKQVFFLLAKKIFEKLISSLFDGHLNFVEQGSISAIFSQFVHPIWALNSSFESVSNYLTKAIMITCHQSRLRIWASAYANFQTNARAVLNSANWRVWTTDYKYHIFKRSLRSNQVTRGHQTFEKSEKYRFFQYLNSSYLITGATDQSTR